MGNILKITQCLLVAFTVVRSLDPAKEFLIDKLIQEDVMSPNRIPGLGLALILPQANLDEFEVFTKGYGNYDVEHSISVNNNTRFLIASISKTFTAVIACKVLSEAFPELGESVLDAPIAQLVPSYNLTLSDRYRTESATFRDLLSHRTCLNSYGLGVTVGVYPTKEERVYRYRYIEEKCGFRSRFEYSNNMMILAGEILSHITKTPFNSLTQHVFDQIGMKSSLIVSPTEDYETMQNMSRGYYLTPDGGLHKLNATHYNGNSGAASGGIISTLTDMAKYMRFHLQNGQINGVQIVPEDVMKWIKKPSNFMDPEVNEGNTGYGLGLFLKSHNGVPCIGHHGDLSPFTSSMSLYPTSSIGIFSFVNGPAPLPDKSGHFYLRDTVYDILHGDMLTNRPVNAKPKSSGNLFKSSHKQLPQSNEKQQIPPQELSGIYGHPYEGDIRVTFNSDNATFPLSILYGIRGTAVLQVTENANVYRIHWFGEIMSLFYSYNGGSELEEMTLDFNTDETLILIDGDGGIEYKRNATLDTYPTIPWDEGSCDCGCDLTGNTNSMNNPLIIIISVYIVYNLF